MATATDSPIDMGSALMSLFQAYQQYGNQQQFSQSNAKASANGTVAALFRDYKNDVLPKIFNLNNQTGTYNSSTAQLLANDAYASTVAKAAQAVMNQQNQFGQLQNNAKTDSYGSVGKNLSVLLSQLSNYKNSLGKDSNMDTSGAGNSGPAAGFVGNYSDAATSGSSWNGDMTLDELLKANDNFGTSSAGETDNEMIKFLRQITFD